MKSAILYSGHLRTWQQCEQNQKDNLPESDTYFYTYERPTFCTQSIQIPEPYYTERIRDYDSNVNDITKSMGVHNSLNQWHNQWVSFCFVPKGYDVYCKSRCDITLSGKIDFTGYDINETNIYIPSGNDHMGGVNDTFAFGSYNVMKKYCSVYLNHKKIFDKGFTFHTESFVTENLKMLGVNIVRIPVTTQIVR